MVWEVPSAKCSSTLEYWDLSWQVNKLHIDICMKGTLPPSVRYPCEKGLFQIFHLMALGRFCDGWSLLRIGLSACPDIRFFFLLHGFPKCLPWSYACPLTVSAPPLCFAVPSPRYRSLRVLFCLATLYECDSSHLISVVSQTGMGLLVSLYRQWKLYFWNIF